MIQHRTTCCRLCLSPALDPILDLGSLAISTFPEAGMSLDTLPRAPLDLRLCRTCGLVQLADSVDPTVLYKQYWYRSSINEAMRAELEDVVNCALLQVSVFADDYVVDVGANDGYLLSCYPLLGRKGITRIAYEPAANLQEVLRPHAEIVEAGYFPQAGVPLQGSVKILTSVAMFYDLDNPHAFVRAVDSCLHPDGVWIVQFQDLAQMVEATAFDNQCHEHLTYWSLAAFQKLLAGFDLHIVEAHQRAINGGSLRLTIRRRVYPEQPSVEHLLLLERPWVGWQALERFAWRVDTARVQIQQVLHDARARGLTVDLYGASTKANTLLQCCGLGPVQIRQAWERNPEKIGRVTVTGIPIVTEEGGRKDPPAILLAGVWQFRDHMIQREAAYLAKGGRMLFPLPEVDLVAGR